MVPVPLLKDVPKDTLGGSNTKGQIWGPRCDPPRASLSRRRSKGGSRLIPQIPRIQLMFPIPALAGLGADLKADLNAKNWDLFQK